MDAPRHMARLVKFVPMSAYYAYIVELSERLAGSPNRRPKVLDYGCGAGQVVLAALDRGLDAYGADLFYRGGKRRNLARNTGHWNIRIYNMLDGGVIPMGDGTFDAVVANQVFEHIDDFSTPLAEIDRVLKPGGLFINIFPSDKVWREGHIGIPFAHWMPRNRLRLVYTFLLRTAGFGYGKRDQNAMQWARARLDYLDNWTHYKSLPEIERLFRRRFTIEYFDADYLMYRIARHPRLKRLSWLAQRQFMKPALAFLSNRLAGHVFVLRKPQLLSRDDP